MKRAHLPIVLCAVIALAACHSEPAAPPRGEASPNLLRVIYRDAAETLIMTLQTRQGAPLPGGACARPLLLDTATGAVRMPTGEEAERRRGQMQLVGAAPARCPAGRTGSSVEN
ncbi:hypothetical protein [Novosphingobium sp.]|uniref:hypothetical protein n=1 Tax=Novosphingobium sp. TaxID=1874826 RepID=UPI00261C582B|nr:hypothetical protein [Novosphingobium sp.]